MFIIGVTGGVGTGKSTVAAMFGRLGAVVIDADAVAHQLMVPKKLAWRQIVKAFGKDVLNDDETINRRKLASLVFGDDARRKELESILHPKVMRQIAYKLGDLRRKRIKAVVLDVPLLIEVGGQKLADHLVVVTAPKAEQEKRLRKKFGWPQEEVHARIKSQLDLSAKEALADTVIDNSASVEATRTQVKRLWKQLISPSRQS